MGFLDLFRRNPTQARFAKLVQQRLVKAGHCDPLRYDAQNFSLLSGTEGDGTVMYLGNLFQEYNRAEPQHREALLRNYIVGISTAKMSMPDDFADAAPDLMPLLRSRTYYEVDLKLVQPGKETPSIPYQVIADRLALAVGYDLPRSVCTVSQDQLEKWGVTLYEALETGKQNLQEKGLQVAQVGSVHAIIHEDSYDATRLILSDLLLKIEVKGRLVAMAPNRDLLLVTGDEDEEGLEQILGLGESAIDHERWISGIPITFVNDEWVPWRPERTSPLWYRAKMLELYTLGADYNSQQSLLEQEHEREGIDIHVASFSAIHSEEKQIAQSYCLWIEGVPSLLPRTDIVLFASKNAAASAPKIGAGWERVAQGLGHRMEQRIEFPERYLVESFPTPEELSAIGVREIAELAEASSEK